MSEKKWRLSDVDKKILKVLLNPDHRYSSKALAKKLDLPETTVQRRRRRLEDEFLRVNYTLDLKKFGWHRVDFFVSTERGKTTDVAKRLLNNNQITFIGTSIGQQTIDLHIHTILRDNAEILQMMELLKGTEGIADVVWSEVVQVVGQKTSVPPHIIDEL